MEPINHKNRKGQTYYLFQGKTRKGAVKYYFSRKAIPLAGDRPVKEWPAGYEVYENVHGQVFCRRPVPRRIRDTELDSVRKELARHPHLRWCRAEPVGKSIVVYEAEDPDRRTEELLKAFQTPFFRITPEKKQQLLQLEIERLRYEAVLRFVLRDPEQRLFDAERWRFSGDEGWQSLDYSRPLAALARKFIRHIGKESFFELY